MEHITSRKNNLIRHIRRLGTDADARRAAGEFVCDGEKLLREALSGGAEVTAALWATEPTASLPAAAQYRVPPELLDYVSPLKTAAGVVFTVKTAPPDPAPPRRALVLETVQDPGNLGTILRTADALDIDTLILTGDCADPYGPKAVRATMGAIFRRRCRNMTRGEARDYLAAHGLRLYGAALSPAAVDIRTLDLSHAAVAVGSEGRGLSEELLALCDGTLVIPMDARSDSLNAAVAAALIMWEMVR